MLVAISGGWVRVERRLPDHRALQGAGCGTAEATNIHIDDAVAGRCQELRLQPVGEVLLAEPDGTQVPAGYPCWAPG